MPCADVNDAQIHYSLEGPSETSVLVLSNSLGTNFSMWDPQLQEFRKFFRVLRYDTRGHGKSSVTPGPYSIEQLGRDVLGLADFLKLDLFHFCGLSMGGQIGMWLGVHAAQRLKKLVLSSTAAKIGTPEMWNARVDLVRKSGMSQIAPAVIERWFTPAFRQQDPPAIRDTRKMLDETNPEGYAANCAAVRDFDFRARLQQIRTPTLVVSGAEDPATTPADGQYLAKHIPGARYVELPSAHLSNVEDADRFTREVVSFLCS